MIKIIHAMLSMGLELKLVFNMAVYITIIELSDC